MRVRWPPIFDGRNLPLLVKVRDVLLTLLAWIAMVWLLRGMLLRLWELATDPAAGPLGEQLLTREFLPYVGMVAFLLATLGVFAWRGRARLRAQPSAEGAPPPLDPAAHAASFRMDPEQLAQLRDSRVSVLRFDAGGRPVGVTVLMGG